MSELQALQHAFWSSVKQRRTDPGCLERVHDGGKISREKRLDIYRTTMREAHVRALASTYAACEKILGVRYFRQLAGEFYYQYPATHLDLNRYGEAFPDFVQDFVEHHQELGEYPYLPDLARLEWAHEQAYYAKEDAAFDFEGLAGLEEDTWRRLRFVLGASVSMLRSDYPVLELWRAQRGQEAIREIEAIDEPQYLCIAREDFRPVIHRIDYPLWWVMDQINRGCTFGELEMLCDQGSIEIPLQSVIPEVVSRRWICGYEIAGPSRGIPLTTRS